MANIYLRKCFYCKSDLYIQTISKGLKYYCENIEHCSPMYSLSIHNNEIIDYDLFDSNTKITILSFKDANYTHLYKLHGRLQKIEYLI